MSHWWNHYPWRMVQTNLRQIDMENMNAEAYAQELQDFGATTVLLNAAGIIASYDTKLPFQPKSDYLHGDSLRDMIDACHKRGIKVICRTDFSKVRYEIYEQHPEWAYVSPEGSIANYNGYVSVCPNSAYQQERKLDIIREVLSDLPFDGVFFNMSSFMVMDYSGVYHGPCHCENCKRLFREQYGEEIPMRDDPRDPVYRKYMSFKNACTKAHKDKLNAVIREINPEIAINSQDYIRTESNTDIGRPQWLYSASSNARLTSGMEKVRPTDNACVDFIGFRYRDISVSPQLMQLRQWQNLANSGCVSMYIMGTLGNHRDTSAFEPTEKVFAFHAAHEDLFTQMKSAAKTVLVRSGMLARDDPEGYGWVRVLTESHIPFDEIKATELADIRQLEGKKLLILGDLKGASPKLLALADEFAQQGGVVISAGETGLTKDGCALKCVGITGVISSDHDRMSSMYEIREEDQEYFPHCRLTPYIMPGSDMVRFTSESAAKKYLRLIPEHPFGPPEICYYTDVTDEPGITVMPYGKGKGIYLPFKAASMYWKEGYANTFAFLQDVLISLARAESIAPDLTPMAEITLNSVGEKTLVQMVNTSGVFGNSYYDPLPIHGITLSLPAGIGKQAKALNGGQVSWENKEGNLLIHLDQLNDYEAIVIE
ncbi:MAG: beta-galactosidase [Clostridia bacterium]|nr:beta-galactosidase [Clostridia bacterium]